MSQFLSFYLLWLVLLLVRFSCELSVDISRARKLCGRHLLQEIVKLCGKTDWSHFQLMETPPSTTSSTPQASRKAKASRAGTFRKHHSPWHGWRRVTRPVRMAVIRKMNDNRTQQDVAKREHYYTVGGSVNSFSHSGKHFSFSYLSTASTSATERSRSSWEFQSLPEKTVNLIPDMIREASFLHDINPHVHEIEKFQKKTTNKIKAVNHLFWGNHPQRKRRGFSDKCCLKGCTEEELGIACLPYIYS
ncbi:insulin-like peptide INSL6 [Perognathus longimembris pacificus]|uniref:insulin-like peptide INSL6 n=1 Tax=Perognathus longimembris pacificus TaxID=214514 RepID=UPI0020195A04|nr:insulin-like peptide INSL6 [Perognathus longimembris pacificus]